MAELELPYLHVDSNLTHAVTPDDVTIRRMHAPAGDVTIRRIHAPAGHGRFSRDIGESHRTRVSSVEKKRAQTTVRSPETMPWDLGMLARAPEFEWVDAAGPIRSVLYEGEPYRGRPTRVFAYYATPGSLTGDRSQDNDLPAVVLLHGGGGTAFRDWVELWAKRGYAAIAMDLAGNRPIEGTDAYQRKNRRRLNDGGPGQGRDTKFECISKPVTEQWTYHAVSAAMRANSLMRSFPEVNAGRIAVTGVSWGGYLTSILAGIDSRFRAAVPVYGCGFLNENSKWLNQFAKMTTDERARWVTLWDPSQYLPAVSMPILFINGTNDRWYPLDSSMKSFDVVPCVKQVRITVNTPHDHPGPQEVGLFIDQHLLGKSALPAISDPRIEHGQIRANFTSAEKLNAAALYLTCDCGPINQRTWQMLPATIEGDTVVAKAPPIDATAWFIGIRDERQSIVSTRVTIRTESASMSGR